jgi:hypothetical protein
MLCLNRLQPLSLAWEAGVLPLNYSRSDTARLPSWELLRNIRPESHWTHDAKWKAPDVKGNEPVIGYAGYCTYRLGVAH